MGVSISKLPGAKPRPRSTVDRCPKCNRSTLVAVSAGEANLADRIDAFVRCVVCDYRGPLGGLRVVK